MNTNRRRAAGLIAAMLKTAGAAAVAVSATAAQGAIVPPELVDTTMAGCVCQYHTPGYTETLIMGWRSPDDLSAAHYATFLTTQLEQQDPAFEGDWSFTIWGEATGSMQIRHYYPFDEFQDPVCDHGAELYVTVNNLKFNKEGVDERDVRWQWVQLVSGSVSTPEQYLSWSDAFDPEIREGSDDLPFYYDHPGRGGTFPPPEDNHFEDRPSVQVDDRLVPHRGYFYFRTLLVSWDGTYPGGANEIYVHGALDWGYEFECVPGPGALTTLVFAALLSCRRTR